MKSMRVGVFETNSSSTHSLVLCKEEYYNKWVDGKGIYYNPYTNEFSNKKDNNFLTYDECDDSFSFDINAKGFIDINNCKMVAVSLYSSDGN